METDLEDQPIHRSMRTRQEAIGTALEQNVKCIDEGLRKKETQENKETPSAEKVVGGS